MSHTSVLPPYQRSVGIDIAAATATVAWIDEGSRPTRAITIAQTTTGSTELQQRLCASGLSASSMLVVLEATGTYWMTLAPHLVQAGFAVSVIHPAQAHAFAKALLKRAKTDAIDAQTLAELGARLQPAPWTPPPAVYTELYQRLDGRDSLLDVRTQLRNQLHALVQQPTVIASVRTRLETLITTITTQIADVEGEIADAVALDDAWASAATRLQTIPGVGAITAGWLLVTTLKFTLCATPDVATSYAGLAPQAYQSGTRVRHCSRIGHMGNARLRRALYLATLRAARYNPLIRTFYERLRAAGKPPNVARCAAARKLLHSAWAVVTKQHDVDPAHTQPAMQTTGPSALGPVVCMAG